MPGCASSPPTGLAGWRRAAKMARRAGWQVNNKRIRRLWRDEGLRVPQRRRKKRLTGIGVAVGAMSPIRPNVIWAMDFQFDTTADGRTLKMLNVIDEFTREALAIEVDRSIDADGVVDVLDRLALIHGAPHYVRFDNGPEFVAHAVSDWCRFNSAGSLFIDPGSPWQNAWIESFNGRLRDELLNSWRFDSLREARVIIEDWRCDYNANRPHSAHGELTQPSSLYSGPRPTNPKSHSGVRPPTTEVPSPHLTADRRVGQETRRVGSPRPQPPALRRDRPMGLLRPELQPRRPRFLRPTPHRRRPSPPSAPSPRQPPRRHPARLPTSPNSLRRIQSLGTPPKQPRQ